MLDEKTQDFIRTHREEDVRRLALKPAPENVDLRMALQQIEGWQTARRKLPSWAERDGILYPPRLPMEQCSSEQTARYKQALVKRLLDNDGTETPHTLMDLTGGFGISNKMPTLMYLYPDYAYFDNASLSKYGTETKDRLGLITTDVVKNTANPDLRPARSTKWEAGLSFRINRIKGFATFFHESHRHELGFTSQLIWQNYDKYTVPATATDPVFDAASGDVTYRVDGTEHTALRTKTTEMYTWSRAANSTTTHKHGIEYGLDFGEIKPLHTSLNISGAWFHIKRKNENMPLNYIYSSFDYVGVLPSGGGNLRDRFNSTFRLITHIPAIKMVFTTSVQVVWYESTQTIYEDENGNSRYYLKSYEDKDYLVVDPMGYYDKQGHYTAWSPADADDADKSRIMYRTQPYLYEKDVIKPWALLSFRFTKEIGRVAELSVIANNFTNTKKWHTNPHSLAKTQLYPDMYFGAELKLKL